MVTVAVTDYRPKFVMVHGAVNGPGKIPFPMEENEMDIVDVITSAGGFTPIAKSDKVRIIRPGESSEDDRRFTRDVEAMIKGERREGDRFEIFMVKPGDIIYVDERYF